MKRKAIQLFIFLAALVILVSVFTNPPIKALQKASNRRAFILGMQVNLKKIGTFILPKESYIRLKW